MCLECDGYSHEEAMQALDLQITIYGWALMQVQGEGETWCYTIGLLENFGHPELTLLDVDLEYQRGYIDTLVEGIVEDGEMSPLAMQKLGVECVEVHDHHLRSDLFGKWAARHNRFPTPGEFLQVVPPRSAFCECHANTIRRLDRPGPLPRPQVSPSPNRAERRRRGRGR
jgi:hypothetical protein